PDRRRQDAEQPRGPAPGAQAVAERGEQQRDREQGGERDDEREPVPAAHLRRQLVGDERRDAADRPDDEAREGDRAGGRDPPSSHGGRGGGEAGRQQDDDRGDEAQRRDGAERGLEA